MNERTLPTGSLKLPRISLGTMTFGGQTDEEEARRIMDLALERGVTLFDTANVYTEGRSETIVGRYLMGRRDEVILATKVGSQSGDGPEGGPLSREQLRWSVEQSLARLGTDHIDLLYLHKPDYTTPIEETFEGLTLLVTEGLVRQVGISNYAAWQVAQLMERCRGRGYTAPVISQNVYNLLTRGIEPELIPCLEDYELGLTVYNPLMGGLLSGKQDLAQPRAGSRFADNEMYYARYWKDANLEAVRRLDALAREAGHSLLELAFIWTLDNSAVSSVLVGASSAVQMEENLTAMEQVNWLTPELREACDAIWLQLCGSTFAYNR